jgi:hypothetical protein
LGCEWVEVGGVEVVVAVFAGFWVVAGGGGVVCESTAGGDVVAFAEVGGGGGGGGVAEGLVRRDKPAWERR